MNPHLLIDAIQLFPVVLIGFILPWMGRTRRGVLFGVSVPLDFATSPIATAAIRRYRNSAIVAASIITLAIVFTLGAGLHSPVIEPVAIVLELIAAMVLWQRERHRMLSHATVVPLERSAELTPRHHAASILATALAVLPLAATALWLHLHWALLPDRWPQHWNAAGQIDGWGVRTPASVYLPLVMGASVVVLFLVILGLMAYAPGAQRALRDRILAPMATLAWSMSLLFCGVASLPLFHLNGVGPVVAVIVLHMIVTFAIVIWIVLRSGFMDTKSITTASPDLAYDGTPDAHWYGGILYYNPADAALLVPKRYGWGWTLNFARPTAWILVAATIGFAIFSIWLPKLLR